MLYAGGALADPPAAETVPGEILVRWRQPLPAAADQPLRELRTDQFNTRKVAGHQVHSGRLLDRQTELLRIDPDATGETLAALRSRDDVLYAEPNYIRRPFNVTPNDEHYPLQWYLGAASVEMAWDLTTGADGTIVAIIDTGIQPHPELEGRLLAGYDFITDPANAGDGDGRDVDPTDVGQNTAVSSGQHGTHVAGIVAAIANNQKGIAGINWKARVLSLRVLGIMGGKGDDADISDAIRWAAGLPAGGLPLNQTPAKVINLSFGSPGYGRWLSDSIGAAMQTGAIVVAAAGNDRTDAKDIYPAAVPGVLTVGATDYDGQLAPYSNFGFVVDIVAPGGYLGVRLPFSHQNKEYNAGIISTMYQTDTGTFAYHLTEGTSQAAPIVSGAISLMAALDPDLTQERAADVLLANANPNGQCSLGCGAGSLDTYASVAAIAQTNPDPPGTDPPPGDVYGTCSVHHADVTTSAIPASLLLLLWLLGRSRSRRARRCGRPRGCPRARPQGRAQRRCAVLS